VIASAESASAAAFDPYPRALCRAQLPRYLNCCSKLLALTSKLAALHAQYLHDQVVLSSVNEIEALTSDLSRKIWPKIRILAAADKKAAAPPEAEAPDDRTVGLQLAETEAGVGSSASEVANLVLALNSAVGQDRSAIG